MRQKMAEMQREVNEFMEYVKHELARGLGDWEQRLHTALVESSPTDMRPCPRGLRLIAGHHAFLSGRPEALNRRNIVIVPAGGADSTDLGSPCRRPPPLAPVRPS